MVSTETKPSLHILEEAAGEAKISPEDASHRVTALATRRRYATGSETCSTIKDVRKML